VLISTHSSELLTDPGISPEELVLLVPTPEGTEVKLAAVDAEIVTLLQAGESPGAVAVSQTSPAGAAQLALFG
jgi:hypothetical protein